MLVTPLPGTDRRNLLASLRDLHQQLSNQRGGGSNIAYDRLLAYLNWAAGAAHALHNQIRAVDIDHLVLTRRHDALLAGAGSVAGTGMQSIVNHLVGIELDQRAEAFGEAISALERRIERWRAPDTFHDSFVVLDTSVYCEHQQELDFIDFAQLVPGALDEPVRVLVPLAVVDELDGLKKSSDDHLRTRSRRALAVMDRLFQYDVAPKELHPRATVMRPDGRTPGPVTLELLFDPPGHVRLPITDEEIIDRTLTIQPLADRQVTLITFDTGQSTRARAAGLKVLKQIETDRNVRKRTRTKG